MTESHAKRLKALRDEVYDCYVRSSCYLQATAFLFNVGMSMNGDNSSRQRLFSRDISWIEPILQEGLECPAGWNRLHLCYVDHKIEKVIGVDLDLDPPRTRYLRAREVFGVSIHSDQNASGELTRYLSQVTEIERIVSRHILECTDGPRTSGLTGQYAEASWFLSLLMCAWIVPHLVSYHVRFNRESYKPHDSLPGSAEWFTHFDAEHIKEEAYRVRNPFRDYSAFERWDNDNLDLTPGLYLGTLNRDVRACTFEAVELLLGEQADAKSVPSWDRGLKELRFNGVLCRAYRQTGENQFKILGAFEKNGWPPSVPSPFDDPQILNQTIKDLNGKRSEDCPIVFSVEGGRPTWNAVPGVDSRSPKFFRTP